MTRITNERAKEICAKINLSTDPVHLRWEVARDLMLDRADDKAEIRKLQNRIEQLEGKQ